jgi:hypothetical protein
VTLTERESIGAIQMVVGDKSVMLSEEELGLLLDTLASLEIREAASVADDLVALRLVGRRIRLLPTECELEVLRGAAALAGLTGGESLALFELAQLCRPVSAVA